MSLYGYLCINTLAHTKKGLGGGKKSRSSVIYESFQGEIKVLTQTKKKKNLLLGMKEGGEEDEDDGTGRVTKEKGEDGEEGEGAGAAQWTEEVTKAPFLYVHTRISTLHFIFLIYPSSCAPLTRKVFPFLHYPGS